MKFFSEFFLDDHSRQVAEYLGDCFDGVKSLNFEKDPIDGRIGNGIISKDKEYVPFFEDVILEGAVETYLTNLESHIRCTLRDILDNARAAAENWEVDKPREIWLQDYCAQLALVTTQLVWTEETARAFDELEGGSETAMKDYKRVCDDRIEKLIKQVSGKKKFLIIFSGKNCGFFCHFFHKSLLMIVLKN